MTVCGLFGSGSGRKFGLKNRLTVFRVTVDSLFGFDPYCLTEYSPLSLARLSPNAYLFGCVEGVGQTLDFHNTPPADLLGGLLRLAAFRVEDFGA